MPNEVKVNGVVLTRKQVEDALAELNAPPEFKGGDIVKFGESVLEYLVVGIAAVAALNDRYGPLANNRVWLVCLFDGTTTSPEKSRLKHVKRA